jgi:uncharacterized flavoprotein (TIGR03862 family)
MRKKQIAIIGGGPAALMLACNLDTDKYHVSIYEKNAALGRKFLVAGKGGFNLTHSEEQEQFADRYTPRTFIQPFLQAFSNSDFREWLYAIGIETYVGTSKRVFPVKGIKPIEVLKAIEVQLQKNKVSIHHQHEWKGWKGEALFFENQGKPVMLKPDLTVFALGGASWKVTGSDGSWAPYISEKGIRVNPFFPSNCAYQVNWDSDFIKKHAGHALKNAEFHCGGTYRKGEVVLTEFGIEGSGVYPLSGAVRKGLSEQGTAQISIDLKPDLNLEEVKTRLENKGNLSVKNVLEKKLNLAPVQMELLKTHTSKEAYHDPERLSRAIKQLTLTVCGLAPIDEAISTVGGIALEELSDHLELKKLPGHYAIGEMTDWDAPTGGYLLQACFSMGYALAKHLNK